MPARAKASSALRSIRERLKWMCATDQFRRAPAGTAARAARLLAQDLRGQEVAFTTHEGLRFVSMPNNFSSFAMCVAGARDPHLWRFIAGRLRPGSTVVDAGANIGTYTIPAARLVAPAGRVVAFEAHPGIMRFLARNIAANALTNVIARNMALGAAPGVIDMVFSAHNPGETHVAGPDESADGRVRVEMTTLDEALAGIGIDAVDYLKIDVEGFELQVLEGARHTIAANPDIVVQTEIETAHADRYGQGRGEMAALLQGLGLTPHEVDRQGRATRLGVSVEQLRYGDLLWFRA